MAESYFTVDREVPRHHIVSEVMYRRLIAAGPESTTDWQCDVKASLQHRYKSFLR